MTVKKNSKKKVEAKVEEEDGEVSPLHHAEDKAVTAFIGAFHTLEEQVFRAWEAFNLWAGQLWKPGDDVPMFENIGDMLNTVAAQHSVREICAEELSSLGYSVNQMAPGPTRDRILYDWHQLHVSFRQFEKSNWSSTATHEKLEDARVQLGHDILSAKGRIHATSR